MLKVGDYVIKVSAGVCRVERIHVESLPTGEKKEYFLLVPVTNENKQIYVPVNGTSVGLRPVLTKTVAKSVIQNIQSIASVEVPDDRKRENRYKEILSSLIPEDMIGLLKHIKERTREREQLGKRMTAIDERYFEMTRDILLAEFSFALGQESEHLTKELR